MNDATASIVGKFSKAFDSDFVSIEKCRRLKRQQPRFIPFQSFSSDVSNEVLIETEIVEKVVFKIPIDSLMSIVEFLDVNLHPTVDNIRTINAKKHLYAVDPYFKDLIDEVKVYVSMSLDSNK